MRIERIKRIKRFAAAVIACSCAGWVALPAAAADASDSPYRLAIGAPSDYQLSRDASYQLATEYRRVLSEAPPRAVREPAMTFVPAPELAAKPFARDIEAAALAAAIDPALVHAVIHVESRHQQKAISPKGARGLMQVMPGTGARYGVPQPGRSPQANLSAGTRYLRDLMHLFDNRLELALAAYNAGEGAVQRYKNRVPPYRETQHYVRDVLAKYAQWRGLYTKTSADPLAILQAVPPVDYFSGARRVPPTVGGQ